MFVHKFLRDLQSFHFAFKITFSKMRNLCTRFLFNKTLVINRLLTSVFVLVSRIVFNRSNGLVIKCLIEESTLKKFQNFNRFQKSYIVKNFNEIKRLKSLLVNAERYLEPKQVSTMELFLWIYLTTYYFPIKVYHRCSTGLYKDLW